MEDKVCIDCGHLASDKLDIPDGQGFALCCQEGVYFKIKGDVAELYKKKYFEVQALETALKEAKERERKLRFYARHDEDCNCVRIRMGEVVETDEPCDCGLEELLKEGE